MSDDNSLEPETCRLGGKAIGLCKWRGATSSASRPGSNHQTVATENGRLIFMLLLRALLSLPSFIVSLEKCKFLSLLAEHVDHVRHSEVVQAVTPGYLEDKVGPDQIVACIKHTNIALSATDINELNNHEYVNKCEQPRQMTYIAEQVFNNLRLARDRGSLNGVLEKLVLLR
jgi:hypothetical protein